MSQDINTNLNSSIEDLLNTLNEIDNHLEDFNNNIIPQIQSLGINVAQTSLILGANLQQQAVTRYDTILNQIFDKGYFTDSDIYRLDSALESQNKAQLATFYGALIGIGIIVFGKIYKKIKEYFVKRKMWEFIEIEIGYIPYVREVLTVTNTTNSNFLKINKRFFKADGLKIVDDADQRERIHDKLDYLIERFKKSSEISSRSLYIKDIYKELEKFNYDEFKESLNSFIITCYNNKSLYAIKSLNYVENIESLLKEVSWELPYYNKGIPEIANYCIQNRNNREIFPKKYKSFTLKEIIKGIRKETIKIYSPFDFIKAFKYSINNIGSIYVPFFYHILIITFIILIIAGYYLYDDISFFVSNLIN